MNEILNDETITDRFREEVINAVRNNPFLKILFKIYNKTSNSNEVIQEISRKIQQINDEGREEAKISTTRFDPKSYERAPVGSPVRIDQSARKSNTELGQRGNKMNVDTIMSVLSNPEPTLEGSKQVSIAGIKPFKGCIKY